MTEARALSGFQLGDHWRHSQRMPYQLVSHGRERTRQWVLTGNETPCQHVVVLLRQDSR